MCDFQDVVHELKRIKALLAMDQIKDFDSSKEKILFLDKCGFDAQEIAELIDTTPGTVAVAKSQAKKKKKGGKK